MLWVVGLAANKRVSAFYVPRNARVWVIQSTLIARTANGISFGTPVKVALPDHGKLLFCSNMCTSKLLAEWMS